LNQKN